MANTATLKPPKPQAPPTAAERPASPAASTFAMLSHRGRVRQANQDACAARPEVAAYVVCDGIGGAAAGEVASRLAAEAFLHALSQPIPSQLRRSSHKAASTLASIPKAAQVPPGHPHTRLQDAVRTANQAVFRHSRKAQNLRGMGTTLVAALLDGAADSRTLWLAHVGDSRCYLFRGGTLQLLTEDHSLVQEQVSAGTLTRLQAEVSPMRSIITRAIGSQPIVEADIAAHVIQPEDIYLLASDGLTRELSDDEIAHILAKIPAGYAVPALQAACQALIDAANSNGGHDNITVLLIACL